MASMDAAVLYRGTLTTTATATLYTVPASTTAIITNIVVANRTASQATLTLDLDTFYVAFQLPVEANSVVTFDMKQVLATTKLIRGGSGTSTALDVHISGVLVT